MVWMAILPAHTVVTSYNVSAGGYNVILILVAWLTAPHFIIPIYASPHTSLLLILLLDACTDDNKTIQISRSRSAGWLGYECKIHIFLFDCNAAFFRLYFDTVSHLYRRSNHKFLFVLFRSLLSRCKNEICFLDNADTFCSVRSWTTPTQLTQTTQSLLESTRSIKLSRAYCTCTKWYLYLILWNTLSKSTYSSDLRQRRSCQLPSHHSICACVESPTGDLITGCDSTYTCTCTTSTCTSTRTGMWHRLAACRYL